MQLVDLPIVHEQHPIAGVGYGLDHVVQVPVPAIVEESRHAEP
jgi:hypothetical protein